MSREERLEWIDSHPLRDVEDLLDYSRSSIQRPRPITSRIAPNALLVARTDPLPSSSRHQPRQPQDGTAASHRNPRSRRDTEESVQQQAQHKASTSRHEPIPLLDDDYAHNNTENDSRPPPEHLEPSRYGAPAGVHVPPHPFHASETDTTGEISENTDHWMVMPTSFSLTPEIDQASRPPSDGSITLPKLTPSELFW